MKARVEFRLLEYNTEIDLEDYGHDVDLSWHDLSQDEQNEITDSLREEQLVYIDVEPI